MKAAQLPKGLIFLGNLTPNTVREDQCKTWPAHDIKSKEQARLLTGLGKPTKIRGELNFQAILHLKIVKGKRNMTIFALWVSTDSPAPLLHRRSHSPWDANSHTRSSRPCWVRVLSQLSLERWPNWSTLGLLQPLLKCYSAIFV